MNITYILVIFREVLEIVLFMNIANLNLKHVSNIKQLNYISLALATIASLMFVFLLNSWMATNQSWQEVTNLIVLSFGFVSILYNANASPKKHLVKLKTSEGASIVLVLFSIIFREYLEIFIFSYGIWAAKQVTLFELIMKLAIATCLAVGFGFFLNKSILIVFQKHMKLFFEVTRFAMITIAGSFLVRIINILLEITTSPALVETAIFAQIEELSYNQFMFNFSNLEAIVYILSFMVFGIKYLPKLLVSSK